MLQTQRPPPGFLASVIAASIMALVCGLFGLVLTSFAVLAFTGHYPEYSRAIFGVFATLGGLFQFLRNIGVIRR